MVLGPSFFVCMCVSLSLLACQVGVVGYTVHDERMIWLFVSRSCIQCIDGRMCVVCNYLGRGIRQHGQHWARWRAVEENIVIRVR